MLHPLISEHLTSDDDADLWDIVSSTLLAKAKASVVDAEQEVYVQIGCCHHWISPHHPIRWMPKGRFAWPFGYDKTVSGWSYGALPEFSWSVFLKWMGEAWDLGRTGKRCLVFRIAIPARATRHLQSAIHTIWTAHSPTTKEKIIHLYGFRKKDGKWLLTASEKLKPRSRRGDTTTRYCT